MPRGHRSPNGRDAPESGHRLELERLSADGWRLCDESAPVDDAAHVIAYLERLPDGVDVVWLYGAFGRDRYATLDEAMTAAAGLVAETDALTRRTPMRIPHFAPAADAVA